MRLLKYVTRNEREVDCSKSVHVLMVVGCLEAGECVRGGTLDGHCFPKKWIIFSWNMLGSVYRGITLVIQATVQQQKDNSFFFHPYG